MARQQTALALQGHDVSDFRDPGDGRMEVRTVWLESERIGD
ncbi:Uncharacterised protein [Starkeya nomas]|uniref:Uncharacterized protein n=1 Tax=Starkeya nomas TaxID=2666134 RepID=A0A5S9NHG1_9HYPH|nr:hypothetical protein [Starkeya nomas]CAA0089937.1 Uncharacterised protein [Starkeya nomas]